MQEAPCRKRRERKLAFSSPIVAKSRAMISGGCSSIACMASLILRNLPDLRISRGARQVPIPRLALFVHET
jgi:hypothetical protein